MKKIAIVAVAMLMLAGVGMAGSGEALSADKGAKAQPVKNQAICPVMGGEVNKKLFVDYQGKRVYVCCMGCVGEVKKDPAKYIAQLEKDGVVLDKTPAVDQPKK